MNLLYGFNTFSQLLCRIKSTAMAPMPLPVSPERYSCLPVFKSMKMTTLPTAVITFDSVIYNTFFLFVALKPKACLLRVSSVHVDPTTSSAQKSVHKLHLVRTDFALAKSILVDSSTR